MKSREPVLVRGRDDWDDITLPESIFHERIGEIRTLLESEGLDAILVYGRGDQDGHLCYASNLVNKVPNWGLLIAITSDSVVVRNERSSRTRPVLERGTWIEDLRFCSNVVEDIDNIVDVSGSDATIGTVGFDTLPYQQRQTFREQVDAVIQCDEAFWNFRSVKTRRERDQIARAGKITAEVHEALQETSLNSVTEKTLATEADRLARLRGVRDVRVLLSHPNGPDRHLRPPEHWTVDPTEPVTVYVAVRYEGYWAERVRTYRLDGETPNNPALDDLEVHYTKLLESIKEGVDVADIVAETQEAVDDSGLTVTDEYAFGHGIGLDIEEPPAVDDDQSFELVQGTTLSVRLDLESDAETVFAFGDTVSVTPGGVEMLTDNP